MFVKHNIIKLDMLLVEGPTGSILFFSLHSKGQKDMN